MKLTEEQRNRQKEGLARHHAGRTPEQKALTAVRMKQTFRRKHNMMRPKRFADDIGVDDIDDFLP